MSPTLIRHNNNPPDYLHHPDSCSCFPCSTPSLHRLILQLFFSQAWSLMLQQSVSEAKTVFSVGSDMFSAMLHKTGLVSQSLKMRVHHLEDSLCYTYLQCLLQAGECLAWHHLWSDYDTVDHKIRDVISKISLLHLNSNPSALVWHREQRASVVYYRDNQDRIERRLETMMNQVSLLSPGEDQTSVVTPDCTKALTSRVNGERLKISFHILKLIILQQELLRKTECHLLVLETQRTSQRILIQY